MNLDIWNFKENRVSLIKKITMQVNNIEQNHLRSFRFLLKIL